MIDWDNLRYLPQENVWLVFPVEETYEIIFPGNQVEPDANRLEFGKKILETIETLRRNATDYLDLFVNYEKLKSKGEWHFEGIEFGRTDDAPLNQFEMMFTLVEDIYGFWYVRYKFEGEYSQRSLPIEFGRRQQ
jgi:hypothetical protein